MVKTDVISRIIKILMDVQETSGRPAQISNDTRPIGDLPGFDSLNGAEVTALVADEFSVDISAVNLFVNDAGDKALTVSQVGERVCEILKAQRQ